MISSHAEHARKCLKVEYLGGIEYDFQKSRVTATGLWDHMVSVSAKKVQEKKFHACVPLKKCTVKLSCRRVYRLSNLQLSNVYVLYIRWKM
jgi:hypothetical protein